MKTKLPFNFLLGFVAGGLACFIVWYWYKSTGQGDGALDLLDRLATTQARLEQAEAGGGAAPAAADTPAGPPPADDLTKINGIGPVFESRLQEAGIHTYAQLAAQDPEALAQKLGLIARQRPAVPGWLAEAAELAGDATGAGS